MSTRENKKLIRKLFEEWNAINGDVGKLRSLYEKHYISDFIHHDPVRSDETSEERFRYMTHWLSTFPDTRWPIDDTVAEGDMVATRYTMRFSHTQEFLGIAPTGNQIVNEGADIRKICGGKVVEIWDFPDTVGVMDQIGALFSSPGLKQQNKFKVGDKVKVSPDSTSTHRGDTGVVERVVNEGFRFLYDVKCKVKDLSPLYFPEEDLEVY